jgi:hypothetical protein
MAWSWRQSTLLAQRRYGHIGAEVQRAAVATLDGSMPAARPAADSSGTSEPEADHQQEL